MRWLNAITALRTSKKLDRRGRVVQPRLKANWRQEEPRDEARPLDVLAIGHKTAILVPQ